jgi:hypothetical protein
MNPAIVVVAYNRPHALARLLASLEAAPYPKGEDVPLVISIDRGADGISPDVLRTAQTFGWSHGTKEVVEQPQRLGLVRHFRECGRQTRRFDGVILLEDDLTVAPPFYDFASRALSCYAKEPRVAGACLYGLWFNGFTREPFEPLHDGSDAFFLRLPYTQGLAFTAEQWKHFDESWVEGRTPAHPDVHPAFLDFPPDEWFPALAYHAASRARYFCFPRVSLTFAWGDAGSHFASPTAWLQTAIQVRARDYRLTTLDDSLAVYDSFFEILPERLKTLAAHLPDIAFDVDLNATKRPANLHHEYVLTTRPVRHALARFGLRLRPPELNVVQAVSGDQISLSHRSDVRWDALAGVEGRRRVFEYTWSHYQPSRRREIAFRLARFVNQWRVKDPSQPRHS